MHALSVSLSKILSGHRNPVLAVEKGPDTDTFFTFPFSTVTAASCPCRTAFGRRANRLME